MLLTVIQARMGSTRLPGKVLRELGGRPVLSWVIRAARASGATDAIVVATSSDASDDPVAELAEGEGAEVVRGSATDVLQRFAMAVDRFEADAVVRLTADCPLLDPVVIRMTARAFDGEGVDYLSTVTPRSLPRGLDVEVVSAAALREADKHAANEDRSHVTSYVWRRPEDFRIAGLTFAPSAADLRVTLDTVEDAALLDAVVDRLGEGPYPWQKIVHLLRRDPDLPAINHAVVHKSLDAG